MNELITSSRCPTRKDIMKTKCRIVFDYWDKLRTDRFAPCWQDFDLLRLPLDAIPFVSVVDIILDDLDARYRFWGTGLTQKYKIDMTGKLLSDLKSSRVNEIKSEFRHVMTTGAPFFYMTDAVTFQEVEPWVKPGAQFIPSVKVPLSDNGETVTNILSFNDYSISVETSVEFYERSTSFAS